MLLINEENHSSICVVNYVFDGIVWLIREKWLDWDTVGIREDEEEFTLKDIIPDSEDRAKWRITYFFSKKTDKERIEIMERFGFYFNEIDFFEI